MELFKLLGKVAIDAADAEKTIDTVSKKAAGLGESMEKTGKKMTDTGKKMTVGISTPLVALGTAAGKMSIDFEDSIANINTLLDDDSHLNGYEKTIIDFSNETGIALDVVSSGMYQTISSIGDGGAETEKMFRIMGKSAKAGGADVSDSVALISAGMKGYNQVNEETAQKISDLGFQTAKLGVTTFPELAKSMQPLFPLSSSLGLTYEELFGVMATGTGVTGNTAEVTTQFKAVLSNLMSPTDDMIALMQQYGYSNAQAMIESEGLSGVLKILQDETGGQADKMSKLFSSTEALTIMTALTGTQFDNFTYKLGEMQNAAGATDVAYDKINTSGDKMRITWNRLKNTATELGDTIITTFGPVIEAASEKIIAFCGWFSSLDDGTKNLIVTIAAIAAAAGPVLIIGGKLLSGAGTFLGAIGKIGPVVTGVISTGSKIAPMIGGVVGTGAKLVGGIGSLVAKVGGVLLPAIASVGAPVLIVIAVIGALVAAGVLLYKNWDSIKEFGAKAWAGITDFVGAAADKISGFFSGIFDFIKNNWQGLALMIVNPFAGGFKLLYDNCEGFRNFVDGFLSGIREGFSNMVSAVSQKAGELKEKVMSKVSELKEKGVQKFHELKDGAIQKATQLRDEAVSTYGEIKEKAVSKLEDLKNSAVERFREIKDKSSAHMADAKEKIVGNITSMKEAAVNKFGELRDGAIAKVNDVKENMVQKFSDIKEQAGQKISDLKESTVSRFKELRDNATAHVNELKEKSVSGFQDLKEKASASISSLKETAINKFNDIGKDVMTLFGNVGKSVGDVFSKAGDKVKDIVEKIKGFFKFDWKLPDIKLPHFKIDGEFSLNPPSIPHFGVEWYAKGAVLQQPTAFGINPITGKIMGGGEAGPEAVAPIAVLQDYIRAAVADSNMGTYEMLEGIYQLLSKWLPELAKMQFVMDTGATIGALAAPMSHELGKMVGQKERGIR